MDQSTLLTPVVTSKLIKGKRYQLAPELEPYAARVLETREITIDPARVKYVLTYPHITKTTAGRCTLANPLLSFFGLTDYIIQMSGDLWDALPENLRYILMEHELRHIYPKFNEKKMEWDFHLRDHDVQDFSAIIKEYGVHWLADIKTVFASVYDLAPEDAETIGL